MTTLASWGTAPHRSIANRAEMPSTTPPPRGLRGCPPSRSSLTTSYSPGEGASLFSAVRMALPVQEDPRDTCTLPGENVQERAQRGPPAANPERPLPWQGLASRHGSTLVGKPPSSCLLPFCFDHVRERESGICWSPLECPQQQVRAPLAPPTAGRASSGCPRVCPNCGMGVPHPVTWGHEGAPHPVM